MFGYPMPAPWNQVFSTPNRVAAMNLLAYAIATFAVVWFCALLIEYRKRQIERKASWETLLYPCHYHWRHYADGINAEMAEEIDEKLTNNTKHREKLMSEPPSDAREAALHDLAAEYTKLNQDKERFTSVVTRAQPARLSGAIT